VCVRMRAQPAPKQVPTALLLLAVAAGCTGGKVEKPAIPHSTDSEDGPGPVVGPDGQVVPSEPARPTPGGATVTPGLQPGTMLDPETGEVVPVAAQPDATSGGNGGAPPASVPPSGPGCEGEPVELADGGVAPAGTVSDIPLEEPVLSFDVNALPGSVPEVQIEIGSDEQASLDANPWLAEDVIGTFIDGNGTRYEGIELNYRGAYALQNLIDLGSPRRNWKVKVTEEFKYLGHREWNFNSEYHVREKLALDLMAFAGTAVPSATFVRLLVNGEQHGLYLQFEDPDNKSWLKDHFGSAAGDLFKAAYDLPNEEPYFAPLTYLGENPDDYLLHYNKKLNNNGDAAYDYTNLIAFIQGLNETPDEDMFAWFDEHFDVERFLNYLVVANFASNWDGYPYRPKNYWLYQSPVTLRWVYLPWDVDHTFETSPSSLMPMGTEVSIFFEFDAHEGPENPGEGTDRPLVRRMMAVPELRQRYVARYDELLDGILSKDYLSNRIRALHDLVRPYTDGSDAELLDRSTDDMQSFVGTKYDRVRAEIDGLSADAGAP
jgi:spore coat protein CotH